VIDLLFFLFLAGTVLARYLEFRAGDPRTATGQPATWGDFRRYAAVLIVGGFAVWTVANVLGNHLLSD
jgi:hypothetical protein